MKDSKNIFQRHPLLTVMVVFGLIAFLLIGRFVGTNDFVGTVTEIDAASSRSDDYWIVYVKRGRRTVKLVNRDLFLVKKMSVKKLHESLKANQTYHFKTRGLETIKFHPTITYAKKMH